MTSTVLLTCRRALREIREIAAVAHLSDSRMTDQEALQSMAGIARWVRDITPLERGGDDCGAIIRRLDGLLAQADLEAMDEPAAMALFDTVATALETGDGGAGEDEA